MMVSILVFFFSSRRRHTRYWRDWSSDVCSSDLRPLPCRNDPDLWFAESPAQLEQAKTLCAECPVRDACLAGALDRGEPWGVWGGEIFERGAVIPRKRPRGRPRKVVAA